MGDSRSEVVRRLDRERDRFATAAIERMEQRLPWFRQMSAQDRSWVGLIAQAGIGAFISWLRDPGQRPVASVEVFGTAPRELARAVSLQQTVEMVRACVEVVEEGLDDVVPADTVPAVREAVLRFSREVAFATAEVYAQAAEVRGAWDARLEALVVDAVLRGEVDEAVRSRAAALGWAAATTVLVVVGRPGAGETETVVDGVRRHARHARLDVLTGVQGDRMLVILGNVTDPTAAASCVAPDFGAGPVVFGPLVTDLAAAAVSARAATAGLRAAPGWPDAPRPVAADNLLPERALSGDADARAQLISDVYAPLASAGPTTLTTLACFLEVGGGVEATARKLFCHPNTIRYRLRRAAEITGLAPADPRDAYTLRVALSVGRLTTATPVPS